MISVCPKIISSKQVFRKDTKLVFSRLNCIFFLKKKHYLKIVRTYAIEKQHTKVDAACSIITLKE